MYTAKHAMLCREKYPDTDVYVFYIDVRTPGKNFDEFYRRAVEEYGVHYIKGMVGKVVPENGKLKVQASDLLDNRQLHIDADMVVLAAAIEPDKSARSVATMLTASMDTNDFFYGSAPPKLRPVESPTAGVFLSGTCQGPKDIPETVAQASAAAAKVIGLLCKDSLTCNPCVAEPNEFMCNGCSNCEKVCPYGAITYIDKGVPRPESHDAHSPRGAGEPGSLSGLRRVHRGVHVRRDGPQGLFQQTDHGGGGCDMQVTWKPTIVAFCCNWCSYAGADLSGTNRLQYPANVKIIRIPCSCRLNPMFILRAFQKGADGVILCGCHPGDCHYTTGNYYARRRMTLLFSMLDFLGIEKGRTRVEWVSAAEGAKFAATMNEFVKTITELGENRRLEDLRCKE